ncbi:MAG: VWA domain-containing protein [Deltaproteobacteria bacterium]|nr:VWA domain-containing protein [Deltaproteobacteria bacterium]
MQFVHSFWLVSGVLACAILGFGFYYFQKKGRAALERFAAGHLLEKLISSVSPGRRIVKRVFLIAAVASIFVALARPQAGFQWKEVKRKGIDILMAVDTSRSMLASDVRPNRLERSKLGIMDFVSRLEGDRVGLIPFAGKAFLMCPLTLDYHAFGQSLHALDTGIIPQGGTDLASAIREAESAFSENDNHRILILVTDGEDLEGQALNAAKEAASRGMTIYTVGVGTPAGELIPVPGKGKEVFAKDAGGRLIKSRLDEKTLKAVAEATGGRYEPLGRQAEGLDAIYREKLSLVPKRELSERMRRVPIDRFEWPLLLAFILLVAEFVISDRRPRPEKGPVVQAARVKTPLPRGMKGAQAASLALILLVSFSVSQGAYASPTSAEKTYARGDYALSAKEYRKEVKRSPDDAQLQFNLGTAAYKDKKYQEALTAFRTALKTSEIELQNKAYYNMGNTLYREGEKTVKKSPQDTIKRWEASIKAYEGALKLNPDDKDACFNLEFVKKKLETLKKKQKQNKKNNKKNQKNKSCKANTGNRDKDKKKNRSGKKKDQDSKQANNREKAKGGQNESGDKQKEKGNTGQARPGKDGKEKGKGQMAGAEAGKQDQVKSGKTARNRAAGKTGRGRRPGQMTQEQARSLLDSLKGEEEAPMVAGQMGQANGFKENTGRDW